MTILDTTTVTIERPPAKADSMETVTYSLVASGVPGRVSGVSGSEARGLGTQEAADAKFLGDLGVDVQRQDRLTDEVTGAVWDVTWTRPVVGLGLDHVVAGLTRSKGCVMTTAFRLDTAAVDRLLNSPDGVVAVALERAAIAVENKAKKLCPVDTGRLRASINHALFMSGSSLTARVGTDVEYAVDVEFGTSRMRAQPFLRPALASVRGRVFSGR